MSLTGRTLGGRYCIQHRVGEGGTAHVYLARDIERDGEVAVKVLLPQLITDSALVERLRREAVIAMLVPDPDATGGLRAVVMDSAWRRSCRRTRSCKSSRGAASCWARRSS
jgi:serine/threonine protein kinase